MPLPRPPSTGNHLTVLDRIRDAIADTPYAADLYEVGGVVRDRLLGEEASSDRDLVTTGDALALARLLHARGLTDHAPVLYERFGTAMVSISGEAIELVRARRESYAADSRKPTVEPATIAEDATRRDFTVNALYASVATGEILDPTGSGRDDLAARILRTPVPPGATFDDDPLRMLRAVRFRHRLGFAYAPGLADAIAAHAERLAIVSAERVRDELLKIIAHRSAPAALEDVRRLGLFARAAPEFDAMKGVDQGTFHHLDVWDHTLLALANLGAAPMETKLAVLFHDIGKPSTRELRGGKVRFFGHETVGAEMTREILARWKLPNATADRVARLVKNHMRLGTLTHLTPAAARRLGRDLGEDLSLLLDVVEADASALAPGVRALDLAPIRARLAEVAAAAPPSGYRAPLSGEEIMRLAGLPPGPEVGRLKRLLEEDVIEGRLAPEDRAGAERRLGEIAGREG